MDWINFPAYAGITFLSWITGLTLINASRKNRSIELAGQLMILLGIVVLGTFITHPKEGIFNVAGDGVFKYSEVARLFKKRLLKLPGKFLELLIIILVKLTWN